MGIFSKLLGGVTGFLTGGPIGAVTGFIGANGGGGSAAPKPQFAGGKSGLSAIIGQIGGQVGSAIAPVPKPPGGSIVQASPGLPPGSGTGQIGTSLGATPLTIIRLASGRRVTGAQLMEMVRVCGIDVTAASLNVDARIICEAILTRRRRRARGISAADLRRTRSTIRKINSMASQLSQLCGPSRRRAAPRRT